MSRLIEWLEEENKKNTKVRAILRRSLAFDPGQFIPAFPYVEHFVVRDESNAWRRKVYYLVAGLWAAHWREDRTGEPMSFGKACAVYQTNSGATSTERRFINLLDADSEQLPHRLRQMVALLKDDPINFSALLQGLLGWNQDKKPTQNAWARDFYLNVNHEMDDESTSQEEPSK